MGESADSFAFATLGSGVAHTMEVSDEMVGSFMDHLERLASYANGKGMNTTAVGNTLYEKSFLSVESESEEESSEEEDATAGEEGRLVGLMRGFRLTMPTIATVAG